MDCISEKVIAPFLASVRGMGMLRGLTPMAPLSGREVVVNGRTALNFSSNNYMGIADHPALKAASLEWSERYGSGSGASRLVTGTLPEHLEVEERLATWKKAEAALVVGAGYMANVGCIAALADRDTTIFADKLNHASLNDGCVLSRAELKRYRHNDPAHLAKLLAECPNERKLIVSDTVFSMDGDVADLPALRELSLKHRAFLYLDDAHASGVLGPDGSGLANGRNCELAMGTFSKALGSYGAYLACSRQTCDYLVNRCGSFIYTTALPPAVWGSVDAAIKLLSSPDMIPVREAYLARTAKLAAALRSDGFDLGTSSTPILPVIVGEAEAAKRLSAALLERGVLGMPIRPPTVPKGSSRLRLTVTAAHTDADLALLRQALLEAKC